MELKGQFKKDFESWLESNVDTHYKQGINNYIITEKGFYNLPPSMQWGVIVDFADSVNLEIKLSTWTAGAPGFNKYWEVFIDEESVSDYNETRQEAREKAIEKLQEIYNNKKPSTTK